MKVLVIGSGGREHALASKLSHERGVEVTAAPGNVGIAAVASLIPLTPDNITGLADAAPDLAVDLTVVGPELPLNLGIVDLFRARGLRILGPSRMAAQLECSKAFAKDFMARHGIPTARYRVCSSADQARALVASGEFGLPVVVKADGLAAGKGVVVAQTADEANAAIHSMMEQRQFGESGARVVLEQCLSGPEVSFFALCDGSRAMPLISAQDHKRAFDNDVGPNTGGMGAFAPSPLVDAAMHDRIMREIVEPVIKGMRADGHEYRGFLYAGLMLTCDGPKVIEFNVRFGDPEAQVVLPLIDDDLTPHLVAAADGRLLDRPLRFSSDRAVGVVLASAGYPGSVTTGKAIRGLDVAAKIHGVSVFHSGTTRSEGSTGSGSPLTAGGRVLTIVARGETFSVAIDRAYAGVSAITFDGMQYRTDIGRKALAT
jgi:phosphoribosylamine---glycine ligase